MHTATLFTFGVSAQPKFGPDASAPNPGVSIEPNRGPVIGAPFRSLTDVDRLNGFEPERHVPYVIEAVQRAVGELTPLGVPLIGFAGAPFTVATYLVEGGKSKEFEHTKYLMRAEPETWCALMDALTRRWKIPLWKFFGDKPRRLATDITIVIADLKETQDTVRKFYKQGFRSFKVKIGRDEDLDIQRVLAVDKLAPRSAIYLDANQGYSAQQTLRFLKRIARDGVRPQLIEQPVPRSDWDGLLKVARDSKIPVCADESARSLSDVSAIIDKKAAKVINIKLMKTGIFESREIAFLAKAKGVKLMVGGMMETSLAMTASAHMAAGLGCFDFVDLDTPFFIKGAVGRNPLLNKRGVYDLKKSGPGIGVRP